MTTLFNQNLVLDGAMGSLLLERTQKPVGYFLEKLNIESPDIVLSCHKDYVDSGSDVVYTNTFGANHFKFSHDKLQNVITSAISIARQANPKYVALDIGPLGKVIGEGGIDFEDAISAFKEIVEIANDKTDFIVVETMTSLAEMRAAILACKETSNLPLAVSMSFDENCRTFFGTSVECFVVTAVGLGVDMIGANCSLGPIEMLPVAKEFARLTNLPIFIKANAGMPKFENGKTIYGISAQQFADAVYQIKKLGINVLGGCCGTSPHYIKLLSKFKNETFEKQKVEKSCIICSQSMAVSLDGNKIVGERINPTGKKRVQQAIREGDFDFLISEGVKQQSQGADILDVNVGVSGIDEVLAMKTVVQKLQNVCTLPLQIDSSKPQAIEQALRLYHGKAIVNSVNGSDESLKTILPVVKKYGAVVIGLTLDENGIPFESDKRVEIATKIVNACQQCGIDKNDVVIDTLTMSEASQKGNALSTLNALKGVKSLGIKTALGVSNISFGMPNREDINAMFLEMAVENGLNLAIVNPAFKGLKGSELAKNFLLAKDNASEKYIQNANNFVVKQVSETNMSIEDAIITGQSGLAVNLAKKLMIAIQPLELSQKFIIPALDEVGKLYEQGKLFLPQLIASADSAKCVFEQIEHKLQETDKKQNYEATFVLATVQGDIHDIGKNIVKTVVSNYGYKVIDLGRDVKVQKVVDAVKQNYPCILGLSALMTTTAENMAVTVCETRKIFPNLKIIVGGAVITQSFAKEINCIYAKDASDTISKLKQIVSEKAF